MSATFFCRCACEDVTAGIGICICLKVLVLEILSNAEEILEATKVLVGEVYDFRGCICLVDCYNFLDQLEDEITIDRQLKHCNLAVLTKVDLVDREKIELIKEKVQEINPVCPITESENGNIKRSFYDMDLMKYQWAECEETTNSAETKPKTFP